MKRGEVSPSPADGATALAPLERTRSDGACTAERSRAWERGLGGEGKRRLFLCLAALLCLLSARAQAQMSGFPFAPERASTLAGPVDLVFYTLLVLSAVIAGSICLLIVFFGFKYRRGSRADRSNAPARNLKLELSWILIPTLLSIGVFGWGARLYFDLYQPPAGALEISVVGKQWMWKLQHPEGRREIDELHIPVGRPIKLLLTSQDVIHSFYVPAFRIKQDAVPGRTTETWFQATRPGTYHLFCTQYCGTGHASMQGWVYVLSPSDYTKWLNAGASQPSMAAQGAKLFNEFGCSGCHGESSTIRAPSLYGLYGKPVPISGRQIVTADDQYLHDSIVLPGAQIAAGYSNVMPSYKGQLSEEQILQLIAFIRSLGDNTTIENRSVGTDLRRQPRVQEQRERVREKLYETQTAEPKVSPPAKAAAQGTGVRGASPEGGQRP